MALSRFSEDASALRAAVELSHLRSLPEETKDRLIQGASLLAIPAGGTLHREGDSAAHLELTVSGLVRVYVTALDGRTLTVRYCRPGSILGAASLFLSVRLGAVELVECLALGRTGIGERHRDRDARRPGADDAEISLQIGPVLKAVDIDEHGVR